MKTDGGYTLLELLIAICLSIILLMAISNFAVTGIIGSNQEFNKTLVLSDAKQAVGVVSLQIRAARSVEASNVIPDSYSPGAPGNLQSWSGAAGNGSALILAVPSRNAAGDLLYKDDGSHNYLYTDEIIFFLNSTDHKLYRRRLADTSAPGNVAKTTCPPRSASVSCPADAVVIDNVANLITSYLDSNNHTVTLPTGTEAISYTVTEYRIASGRTFSGSYSTIATLRNK